jgi:hypothetical protein
LKKVADHWRGFNRNRKTGRGLPCNQAQPGPSGTQRSRDPRAFAAPQKQQPGRTPDRFPLLASLPQRSDLALLLLGNEWPMVAGSNCGDKKAFGFPFRIINP